MESQQHETRSQQLKVSLDNLIEDLCIYKDNAYYRLTESSKWDPLTKSKYKLSNELWANLCELRSDYKEKIAEQKPITDQEIDRYVNSIKFYYDLARYEHENVLNQTYSYYFFGKFFKSIGYLWGELGKHLDNANEMITEDLKSMPAQVNIPIISPSPHEKALRLLDDLSSGLFSYKETTLLKEKNQNDLTKQKLKITDELLAQLTIVKNNLTLENAEETFQAIKNIYVDAHLKHEKILNEIIPGSYAKYLPTSMNSFFKSYLGFFYSYLGSYWAGNLAKEIYRGETFPDAKLTESTPPLPDLKVQSTSLLTPEHDIKTNPQLKP